MVLVDDKKLACESCIKGHRSSGCQHTDRPLFEVKKKGRPVSQCQKCRDLRKTKRMHGKCTCSSSSLAGPSVEAKVAEPSDGSAPKAKARRFKPIAPALPNGLKDVLRVDRDTRLDGTLNLCRCGGTDASICTCGHERGAASSSEAMSGLAALAHAAMFCCSNDLPTNSAKAPSPLPQATPTETSRKHTHNCCSGSAESRPPSPKPKRHRSTINSNNHAHRDDSCSATASSLASTSSSSFSYAPREPTPPTFPPPPPLTAMTYVADSGCCCGTDCACPGCTQHRGQQYAAKDYGDCEEGECGTCVDNDGGIALPERSLAYSQGLFAPVSWSTSTSRLASIDTFFATAASLPAPPPGRTGVSLDPTNVLVYPRGILEGDKGTRSLFGLVEVPKLQCSCPGGCGCPEGGCACGDACGGCAPRPGSTEVEVQEEEVEARAVGSCCAR